MSIGQFTLFVLPAIALVMCAPIAIWAVVLHRRKDFLGSRSFSLVALVIMACGLLSSNAVLFAATGSPVFIVMAVMGLLAAIFAWNAAAARCSHLLYQIAQMAEEKENERLPGRVGLAETSQGAS